MTLFEFSKLLQVVGMADIFDFYMGFRGILQEFDANEKYNEKQERRTIEKECDLLEDLQRRSDMDELSAGFES